MTAKRLMGFLILCTFGVLLTVGMTACSVSMSEAATVLDEETLVPQKSEAMEETTP